MGRPKFHFKCTSRRRHGQPCSTEKTHSIITMQEHMFVRHLEHQEANCLAEWICSCGIKFLSRMFVIEHAMKTRAQRNAHIIARNDSFNPNVHIPKNYVDAAKRLMDLMRHCVDLPSPGFSSKNWMHTESVDSSAQPIRPLSHKTIYKSSDRQGFDPNSNSDIHHYNSGYQSTSAFSFAQIGSCMKMPQTSRRGPVGELNKVTGLLQTPEINAQTILPPSLVLSPPRKPQEYPRPCAYVRDSSPPSPSTPTFTYNNNSPKSPGQTANLDSDSDDEWSFTKTEEHRRTIQAERLSSSNEVSFPQHFQLNQRMVAPSVPRERVPGVLMNRSFGSSVVTHNGNSILNYDRSQSNQAKQNCNPSLIQIPSPDSRQSYGQRQGEQDSSYAMETRKRRAEDHSTKPKSKTRASLVLTANGSEFDAPPMNKHSSTDIEKRMAGNEAIRRREHSKYTPRGGRYVGQNPQPLVKTLDTHSLGEIGSNLHEERELGKGDTPTRVKTTARSKTPTRSRQMSNTEEMARERERSRSFSRGRVRARSRSHSRGASPSATKDRGNLRNSRTCSANRRGAL